MIFSIGGNRIEFREGFKMKSFSKFRKIYSSHGRVSDEELKVIFDKLNGNDIRADKKVKKADRKSVGKAVVSRSKESRG